jgi:hypothetical protein
MSTPALHLAPSLPTYVVGFPLPDRAPYSIAVDMGIVRSDSSTGAPQQRRVFGHMPQRFSLVFHMRVARLALWQLWVNETASDWFYLPLASMYAAADQVTLHAARFIGDLRVEMDGHDWLRVTVAAELAPAMFATFAPPVIFNVTADSTLILADSTLLTADNFT